MRSEVLPEPTRKLLEKFRGDDLPSKSYLGGGTAIALWLGHRQSVDLDWFTSQEFDENMWQMKWETKWDLTLRGRDWQTLVSEIESVKTALYFYKYPLIDEATVYNGVEIAGLKDLAAMKLDTVKSRGTKRDFIDLYFLTKQFGADRMFEYYDHKYGHLEDREVMLRKALVYFTEADGDEMPRMLVPVNWEDLKTYFLDTLGWVFVGFCRSVSAFPHSFSSVVSSNYQWHLPILLGSHHTSSPLVLPGMLSSGTLKRCRIW